jgi:hypothetical protein
MSQAVLSNTTNAAISSATNCRHAARDAWRAAELAAVRAETEGATSRAGKRTKAKQIMLGLGFRWVRENVTDVYGRTLLSELSGAELAQVYAAAVQAQRDMT